MAGLTSVFALVDPTDQPPADRLLMTDLKTGGFLTLAIAGVLAAVSTGVLQAGRVIDQRSEYRALSLAGTDERTLDRARLDETLVPLLVAVGVATVGALMLMLPVLGATALANVAVVGQFLLCVLGASALVLAATWTTRAVAHTPSPTAPDADSAGSSPASGDRTADPRPPPSLGDATGAGAP